MRRRDCDKEQRLKEAVIKLIREEGFEGTSISKITREAGVSPATVYIYYDSKEQMLESIYEEYAKRANSYMMSQIREEMEAPQIIRALLRGYYHYITENQEIFGFVEQCSHCPTLSAAEHDYCQVYDFLDRMKGRGYLRPYSNESLAAIMFYPVKAISLEASAAGAHTEDLLEELIRIVQDALLF